MSLTVFMALKEAWCPVQGNSVTRNALDTVIVLRI